MNDIPDKEAKILALYEALLISRQYLMLAVYDSKGDLKKIAQRDLDTVDAALLGFSGVVP